MIPLQKTPIKTWINLLVASVFCSLLAGGFIVAVNFAAATFKFYSGTLVWVLPLAGLCLYYFGQIKHFKNCEQETSPALAPYMYLTAFWSHLFGASVGREGAAVQIGSSVAEFLRRRLKHEEIHRSLFAHAGVAAAFCVALGTPLSAITFSLEYKKSPNRENAVASMLGSLVGWVVLKIVPIQHWHSPFFEYKFTSVSFLSFIALCFSLWALANSFMLCELVTGKFLRNTPSWITLPASGMILGLFVFLLGHTQFNNFSTPLLDRSFSTPAEFSAVFGKMFFTLISLAGGWKGGAFVPLMVVGGLFASWISLIVGLSTAAAAALGTFSIINRKFNIPLTAILITGEIFSWQLGLLSIPVHLFIGYAQPRFIFEKVFKKKFHQEQSHSI